MTDRLHRSRGSQHDKWLHDAPSALARVFAPVAGYGVTISSMFRPVVTEQYPFESPQVMPRYHGRHQLNRYDDGLEKCIGRELCAWACSAGTIYVEAASNEPDTQYSLGERYGRVYQVNYLRCIFCGMCIKACPARTLAMSTDFDELVGPGCKGPIYEEKDLLAPMPKGAASASRLMVESTRDSDCCRGKVVGSTQAQIDWMRSHRPEDPGLESARAKAAPTASDRGSRHIMKRALQ